MAIEYNAQALRRVLVALIAMAGLGPSAIAGRSSQPAAVCPLPTAGCPTTLPRRLHRAILRLLRPAEAAARRLIIALSRGVAVPPPSVAAPKARQQQACLPGAASAPVSGRAAGDGVTGQRVLPGRIPFPLIDPSGSHPFRQQPVAGPSPRICVPGVTAWRAVPRHAPCLPGDPIDAGWLGLRLAALGRALADLPGQARRFARWRRRLRRVRRVWPLRMGRPPGASGARDHEVHDILVHANALALYALEQPDTS